MQHLYTLALVLTGVAAAFGQTRIYVTADGTGGGTSWGDARGDLAAAMAQAQPNTEIWVAQGTYFPTVCTGACTPAERVASFQLRPGVAVIGGFTGAETMAAEADPTNVTTLSGDIGVSGDAADNTARVVVCNGCGTAASLANLTIADGNADVLSGGLDVRDGGGLFLQSFSASAPASPMLTDCTLRDNRARSGGGMYVTVFNDGDASFELTRCLITANVSTGDGGGLYLSAGGGTASPTLTDTRVVANETVNASQGIGISGAGLYATANAGAYALMLDRCLVADNRVDATTFPGPSGFVGAVGGGLYLRMDDNGAGSTLAVRNSVISGNSAFSGGGAYALGGVGVTYVNVTTANNVARGSGGSGGGLYLNRSRATVVNSISYGNSVPNNFDAGRDFRFVNGQLAVSYTLLEAADADAAFSRADPINNTADSYAAGAGMIYGQAPDFADANAQVPELTSQSPARDAGENAAAVTAGGDYFGLPRIDGGTVDLGAAEFQVTVIPVELVYFRGEPTAEGALLTWATAAEIDAAGFRVLRSSDTAPVREIGFVAAAGPGAYRFADESLVPGTRYYYRLESVDLDGSTERSAVVTVVGGGAAVADIRVFPNPATDQVFVTSMRPDDASAAVPVALTDVTGRVVRTWRSEPGGRQALSLRDVPAGVYVLRVGDAAGAGALLTVRP